MRSRCPQKPCARFGFPPGVYVVFKLRPQRQPEFILQNRNLVLHERAVNIVVFMMRQKVEGSDSLDKVAGTPPRSNSPDNFISLLEDEVVDQVDVESVASFSQLGPQTVGSVIIRLN